MRLAVATVASHLVGCFPSAALVGRLAGFDPAASGSGNPGATNALRLGGRGAGALVLALDAAKGAIPAAAGLALGGRRRSAGLLLGAAAVSGHVAPVTNGFRGGGKGVATAAGTVAVVDPAAGAVAAVAFGLTAAATRRASLASLVGAAAVPVAAVALRRPWREVAGWVAVAGVVAARHRENIRRLAAGTEPATSISGA